MSTTVTYKGNTITTVNNETRTLLTQDKWVEDDIVITDESRGGGVDTETDPVFSASPAAFITQSDIINWNTKSNFSGNYNDLTNKPTIPAAQVSSDWNATSGIAQILHKPTLSDVATSGDYEDLINKPNIPTAVSDLNNDRGFITTEIDPVFSVSPAAGITSNDITSWNNKSDFSGSYNDLTDKPTIAGQVNSDWNANSGVAKILNKPTLAYVAMSGNYNDLTNKPVLDTSLSTASTRAVENQAISIALEGKASKQYVDTAISNIPSPMVFKGSLGTSGTITTLPSADATNTGFTYKVIQAGTYASQAAEIGDIFISDGTTWILVPSGDDIANVVVTPVQSSGTKIAVVTVNNTSTDLYAPTPVAPPNASTLAPNMDGTAAAGTSTSYARADHIHPVDTSRASANDVSNLTTRVGNLETAIGTGGSVDNKIATAIQGLDSSITATSGEAISAITITDGKITTSSKITIPTYSVATTAVNGLMSAADKAKINALSTVDNNTTYANATTASDGLMSAVDKIKLDNCSTGSGGSSLQYIKDGTNDSVLLGDVNNNIASGLYSIAEGNHTTASGEGAHAEGSATLASTAYSHAEGVGTIASGPWSHAEGNDTIADSYSSHAEGCNSTASGSYSHAEGYGTLVSAQQAHAEGNLTTASGSYSHAEGNKTKAYGIGSHAEGLYSEADVNSHAEGIRSVASGGPSHAEGNATTASGENSHAEGNQTIASGIAAHAEGSGTTASGYWSHVEGLRSITSGYYAHGEGYETTASGNCAHAEGYGTNASTAYAHAEGTQTIATGKAAHAEGGYTLASEEMAHTEGNGSTASGKYSHAEGLVTEASGHNSHAEGEGTIANHKSQHSFGAYNLADPSTAASRYKGDYIEIVGNGDVSVRSNARTLDWSGNEVLAGKLTVGANPVNNMDVVTKQYMENAISTISGGGSSLSYVADGSNQSVLLGKINDNEASGIFSIAEGAYSKARGARSHAECDSTLASGVASHAEGDASTASGDGAHAEGSQTYASGDASHTEGYGSNATTLATHAEGIYTTASKKYSHAEGNRTHANGEASHAEGYGTETTNDWSHAEGNQSTASGNSAHAEGGLTLSSGYYSHSEGEATQATTKAAHAEGINSKASGMGAHAEGNATTASGYYSHANGDHTVSAYYSQTVIGSYNTTTGNLPAETAFVIGNGTSAARSDAFAVKWDGTLVFANGAELSPAQVTQLLALLN